MRNVIQDSGLVGDRTPCDVSLLGNGTVFRTVDEPIAEPSRAEVQVDGLAGPRGEEVRLTGSSVQNVRETLVRALDTEAVAARGPRDVEELIIRLRGHSMQLAGALLACTNDDPLPPELSSAIEHVRRLRDQETPIRLEAAINHLVALAEAISDLLNHLTSASPSPARAVA
jgi:hypothetical protein